ncbi:DNA topoisomerase 2-binding protein 1-A [Anopheles maculipalpis]|uniref:DNA topoisomerase 2-binding protein 1-A n=1 Tax=Anopheles maculipalpis TaxID=1496333 RepID=UPI002159412F|nr:DNA topoisomerase 2-binding protein 1-A [Anopheles maculipalpis]
MNSQLLADQQLAKLYFVLRAGHSSNENASEDMQMAYSTAREHNDNEELQGWITEDECLKMDEKSLTKRHVFVFEKFSGSAFEHARKSPSTVIGPRCLISCFMDNETIPLGVHPVYTTAMRNLTVCSSGLKAKEKSLISQLVCHMGGYYLDVLNASCTHLVSSTVKSVKYEKAAECKLPIMHPDWVNAVWEESQRRDLHATEPGMIERYRLPVFFALTITSTGLTAVRKNEIKSLIESNGGNYVGSFKSETTDILILEKTGTDSAKFRGAVRCNKECLTPEWIVDSVASGYVLPVREYEVKSLKASTPTKDNEQSIVASGTVGVRMSGGQFNPDCTQLSEISHANFSSRNETINDSVMSGAGDANPPTTSGVQRPAGSQRYREVLARMTVQQAKKAGPVLDGCSVFLSGFTADEKEKLNKILNSVGAVRYDEISGAISHVIVGEQHVSELAKFRDSTAHLLTLDWLAKSIELHQLAPEDASEYTFQPSGKGIVDRAPEPPSPSSKKNLQRMNSSVFKRPDVPKFRLEEPTPSGTSKASVPPPKPAPPKQPTEVDSIMLQYMEKNMAEKLPVEPKPAPLSGTSSTSSMSQLDSELESQYPEFMLGKTLFVFGFTDEDAVQILSDCKECGGTIVDERYTDEVDYIVLPTTCIGTPDFAVRGKHTVNCIWLETSIQSGQCCSMEYYYEPIIHGENDPTPLADETVVISSYSGPEREFLIALGKILGACVQERLVRKAAPLLVCKEAAGAKYNAAIQWDLTVVRAEWLRECARQKRRVPENPYLVGDSICSVKNNVAGAVAACFPTTSTDDVDIDSVREEVQKEPKDEEPSMMPQASSTMKPLPKPTSGGEFQYITVQKTHEETELQYGFKRLSTPKLRQLTSDERMLYSQEMDQYEDLIKAQRAQRKPFDPNEGTLVPGAMESPARDVLRTRRFTAISEAECRASSSSSRSPVTPVGAGAPGASSANVTPIGAAGEEYEAMSVTQRVMDFDTPIRTTLYKVLKEAEEADRNITPRTRRVQELLATPHAGPGKAGDGRIRTPTLPECMTKPVTPYGFRPDASPDNHAYHKRKLQHWDRYYKTSTASSTAAGPAAESGEETASQKARRLSTPISEIKRRFYVEKFGDGYANHIESKCTTAPRKMPDLNHSGDGDTDHEEEIANTAPQPQEKGPTPPVTKAVVRSANSSSGSLERSNTSADKRSRSELEEHEEDDLDESDKQYRSPARDEQEPAAKKPLLNVGRGDEFVQRLSDVIAAAKESAKKKAKIQLQPDTEHIPTEQYTEMDYDSEINVGGVVWRERDIENIQANESTKPSSKGKSNDTIHDKSVKEKSPARAANPCGMKHKGIPVFAISGVPENVRQDLARKIEHLQGQLASDPNRYDPECTHILCGKPNRGEKMLSGIAAGKWLLSTKYLDDSYDAGYFLDEESYEWGNPKAASKLTALASAGDLETAAAAYTWRTRIANDVGKRDGAFTGFRVLLVVPKKDQFVRLIQSGGGFVLDLDPPFISSERAMSATHCFVDRKAKLSSEDHRALAEAGIAVLSIMYLNAYLTSASLPDPNNFQLPI